MRKCLSIFLILVLFFGLFVACTSSGPLDSLLEQLGEMEGYRFVAVGEVSFAEDAQIFSDMPLRYQIYGTRTAGQDMYATITYMEADDDQLPAVSLIHTDGISYVGFLPLFQRVMDQTYTPFTVLPVSDTFDGDPYLLDPAIALGDLPINFPALIHSLDDEYLQEGLSYNDGLHTLTLSGEQFPPDVLTAITQPFALFSALYAHSTETEAPHSDPVLETLRSGDLSAYTLELMFMMDEGEEESEFIMWLTLEAPGLMTITADVTYLGIPYSPISPPGFYIDVPTMRDLLVEYRDAQAQAILLERHELAVIFDLPELHMIDHEATDLLIPFDMEVGEEVYSVSVMVGATNTAAHGFVHSFTPGITLLYTTLDASSASATMAPFVLEEIGVDPYDGENFQRTALRVNAHDTAAVKALYFDDNLVGRTLHVYVLQCIYDSDYALFLAVIVMLDHFTAHAYAVLNELGFLIGIDLLEYVALAQY